MTLGPGLEGHLWGQELQGQGEQGPRSVSGSRGGLQGAHCGWGPVSRGTAGEVDSAASREGLGGTARSSALLRNDMKVSGRELMSYDWVFSVNVCTRNSPTTT